jgi:hypothetical protein
MQCGYCNRYFYPPEPTVQKLAICGHLIICCGDTSCTIWSRWFCCRVCYHTDDDTLKHHYTKKALAEKDEIYSKQ